MKKYNILLICLVFVINSSKAQVGIGTTNPNAQLDVVSSNPAAPANNDGILIPKIDVFPATNPTALQQGMLVYLTTATTFGGNSKPIGFYYWDNVTTNWIGLQTTANTDWSILGNSNTNPSNNFIGTIDDKDFVIKRNNVRAGYIGDPYFAPVTYNYNNGNTSFGANSMVNPSISIAGQTGVRNSAFGANVMPNLSSGYNNIGIGDFALYSNTSGFLNIGIGSGALYSNATANNNVAIGRNTLTTSNGNFNTAVGNAALRQNASGANNTAVGFETLRNVTGSGNVALGYQAGRAETGSNKLYIENTSADANNALIYGDFGTSPKILRTNSQFQIGNPAVAGYALPTTRGTAGQLLQTNGAGATTWVDMPNNISVVRTNLSSNQSLGTGGWQKINFNTVLFDTKTEYNTTSNRFVASKAGYYEINAGFHTDGQANTQYYSIGVYVNGNLYHQTSANHFSNGFVVRTINCTVSLNANDYVEIFVENYQSGVNIDSFSGKTYFEIKQLR